MDGGGESSKGGRAGPGGGGASSKTMGDNKGKGSRSSPGGTDRPQKGESSSSGSSSGSGGGGGGKKGSGSDDEPKRGDARKAGSNAHFARGDMVRAWGQEWLLVNKNAGIGEEIWMAFRKPTKGNDRLPRLQVQSPPWLLNLASISYGLITNPWLHMDYSRAYRYRCLYPRYGDKI